MATGAGKAFTAIIPVYRLLKFGSARRILFLVNLGKQAHQEFMAYTPPDDGRKFSELYNVQRVDSPNIDPHAQVCVSTIQRMCATLSGEPIDESTEDGMLVVGGKRTCCFSPLPRMIRKNLRYDGNMIELAWKSTKIDKPKVFAICDVSGSVANDARFMLMFLYSLEEVLPNVRAFAFSLDLGEVTDLFARHDLEDTIAKSLRDYSCGSTDCGLAFADVERIALDQVDQRSTVIILGDARNDNGEPRTDLLLALYDRSRRVIWPNPELAWGSNDSQMRRYQAHGHQVNVCNSLTHLELFVSELLRAVT